MPTKRALRVFSVLEHYRAGSENVLESLIPFFEPIIAEFNDQVLNPHTFAEKVRQDYHWNFTADIVEEFIPLFIARKWLEKIATNNNSGAYKVIYKNSPDTSGKVLQASSSRETLSEIGNNFLGFVQHISPLVQFGKSSDELIDILIEWLVSIDAYTEDVLRNQAVKTVLTGKTISMVSEIAEPGELTSEERYLCARYVRHLHDHKSPYISDLCQIAAIGLLTEVVQDFRKPITSVNNTNICIYLDAPVALDLLGVSGKAAAENIRPIISQLQQIGASVNIFKVSVDELRHALDAVLRRPPTQRTGPTADSLRRNEVLEAYVRSVANDPETVLQSMGVKVVARKLDQYPGEYEHFTDQQYRELFDGMKWHTEVSRREHDSTIVGLILRMRKGSGSRDLFQTRHILITRNAFLAQFVRRFCIDNDLIDAKCVPPVIQQRQLATAVWLRTGLNVNGEDVPRRYLIAACEKVLELKKNVVDQVKATASKLTPETARQLDLLLTEDRSVQMLMDKTLGISHIITDSNIGVLLELMKQSLVSDLEKEKTTQVTEIRKKSGSEVREANKARSEAESRASELDKTLSLVSKEDQEIVNNLIQEINELVSRRYCQIKVCIGSIILLIGVLPPITNLTTGTVQNVVSILGGVIGGLFAYFQLLDKPLRINQRLEEWGQERLNAIAKKRGLEAKLMRFGISYLEYKFSLLKTPVEKSLDRTRLC